MQDLNKFTVLIVPGVGGSGNEHWQTFWEEAFPEFQRVQQADWDRPVYSVWAATLSAAVEKSAKPVVLVGHSLGTSLTMRWSHDHPALAKKVAGVIEHNPSKDISFTYELTDSIKTKIEKIAKTIYRAGTQSEERCKVQR